MTTEFSGLMFGLVELAHWVRKCLPWGSSTSRLNPATPSEPSPSCISRRSSLTTRSPASPGSLDTEEPVDHCRLYGDCEPGSCIISRRCALRATSRSPGSSITMPRACNGCDIEVLACLSPLYDVERFGIINTGNPKHADVLVITGGINEQNREVVRNIYDQMPSPKVVVAVGICACTGGGLPRVLQRRRWYRPHHTRGRIRPGLCCTPESIIDGSFALFGSERRRQKWKNKVGAN